MDDVYQQHIDLDRAALQRPPSQTNAPDISIGNSIFSRTPIGTRIVRYTLSIACTGSAQNLKFQVSKPHRLCRTEFQQVVTATGAADTTGLAVKVQRGNQIQAAGSSGTANVTLLNQANVAQDSIIFLFGEGWESDTGTYNVAWTGQNNDTLTMDVYIQYLM